MLTAVRIFTVRRNIRLLRLLVFLLLLAHVFFLHLPFLHAPFFGLPLESDFVRRRFRSLISIPVVVGHSVVTDSVGIASAAPHVIEHVVLVFAAFLALPVFSAHVVVSAHEISF